MRNATCHLSPDVEAGMTRIRLPKKKEIRLAVGSRGNEQVSAKSPANCGGNVQPVSRRTRIRGSFAAVTNVSGQSSALIANRIDIRCARYRGFK